MFVFEIEPRNEYANDANNAQYETNVYEIGKPVELGIKNFLIKNNKTAAQIAYCIYKIKEETDIPFYFEAGDEAIEKKALQCVITNV